MLKEAKDEEIYSDVNPNEYFFYFFNDEFFLLTFK